MKTLEEISKERYCPLSGFGCNRECMWYLQPVGTCAIIALTTTNIGQWRELMGYKD